jgi:hypothetical protein
LDSSEALVLWTAMAWNNTWLYLLFVFVDSNTDKSNALQPSITVADHFQAVAEEVEGEEGEAAIVGVSFEAFQCCIFFLWIVDLAAGSKRKKRRLLEAGA